METSLMVYDYPTAPEYEEDWKDERIELLEKAYSMLDYYDCSQEKDEDIESIEKEFGIVIEDNDDIEELKNEIRDELEGLQNE